MSLAGQGPMGVRYCLACTHGIGKGIDYSLDFGSNETETMGRN